MGAGAALHIISEPEAAAMYALDALDPHGIEIGDTFVLCDAGGGTVGTHAQSLYPPFCASSREPGYVSESSTPYT